jgi:hypothetical protein
LSRADDALPQRVDMLYEPYNKPGHLENDPLRTDYDLPQRAEGPYELHKEPGHRENDPLRADYDLRGPDNDRLLRYHERARVDNG